MLRYNHSSYRYATFTDSVRLRLQYHRQTVFVGSDEDGWTCITVSVRNETFGRGPCVFPLVPECNAYLVKLSAIKH